MAQNVEKVCLERDFFNKLQGKSKQTVYSVDMLVKEKIQFTLEAITLRFTLFGVLTSAEI